MKDPVECCQLAGVPAPSSILKRAGSIESSISAETNEEISDVMVSSSLNNYISNFFNSHSARSVYVPWPTGSNRLKYHVNTFFVKSVGKATSQQKFKMETPIISCVLLINATF